MPEVQIENSQNDHSQGREINKNEGMKEVDGVYKEATEKSPSSPIIGEPVKTEQFDNTETSQVSDINEKSEEKELNSNNDKLELYSRRREISESSESLSVSSDSRRSKGNVTSIFNEEKKDTPAWLQKNGDNKYDKYGRRERNMNAQREEGNKDDRYSKYMSLSTTHSERIKRGRSDDTSNPEKRKRTEIQEASEAKPYDSLSVSNASQGLYQTFQSNIYNKESKDLNAIIRSHYNQRTQQSKFQGSRTNSPIYKLRNFNNAIKYILLNNWFPVSNDKEKPKVILDLCCGKGGDLNKCEFVGVNQYIGVDISDMSIKEAFSRYSRNKARFIPSNKDVSVQRDTRRYNFEACFATGDCFSTPLPDILEPNFPGILNSLFPVDCVSMQFSMHYAFENEQKVEGMLMNVAKSLRSGGRFIGTIPSSDFIRDKIVGRQFTDDVSKTFGNDLYTVRFQQTPPSEGVFKPPFGHTYNYSLRDAIDDVPEYVVPFEAFRGMCERHGLILKYKKNFIDIFNSEFKNYFNKLNKNLIEGMRRSDGKYGVEGQEKEVVGFYIGFVFEKVGA